MGRSRKIFKDSQRDFARAGAGDRKLTRRAKLCRTHLAALCCTDPHREFRGKSASRCRIATNPSQDLLGRLVSVEEDSTPANTADNPQVDTEYAYDYDANDRLTDEYVDNDGTTGTDQTTTYAYDHTQQTSKTVTDSSSSNTISKQIFGYNLQGRMSSVINEGYDGSGVLNSQTRTSYEYDSKSYRVKLVNETAPNLDGIWV